MNFPNWDCFKLPADITPTSPDISPMGLWSDESLDKDGNRYEICVSGDEIPDHLDGVLVEIWKENFYIGTASIGGFLTVGEHVWALSVAHVFYPRQPMPMEPFEVDKSELESLLSDGLESDDDSDLDEDFDQAIELPDTHVGWMTLPSHATTPLDQQILPPSRFQKRTTIGSLERISKVPQPNNGVSGSLDWALIAISHPSIVKGNKIHRQDKRTVAKSGKNTVEIITHRETKFADIVSSAIFGLPLDAIPQPVLVANIGTTAVGDSGSWVFSLDTREAVGMLIGNSQTMKQCYILGMDEIISDIEKQTGLKVKIAPIKPFSHLEQWNFQRLMDYQTSVRTRSDPEWAALIFNLGSHLEPSFQKTGIMSHLDEAILSLQEANDKVPQEHPNKARFLYTLGMHLAWRYEKIGSSPDIEDANRCFFAALQQETSPVPYRFKSAQYFLSRRTFQSDSVEDFRAAEISIALIPRFAPHILSLTEKQHKILDAAGLASDAAAIALNAGKSSILAASWLETGRGIPTSIAQQLHLDFKELRLKHPSILFDFHKYRKTLDDSVSDGVLTSESESEWPAGSQVERHVLSQVLTKTLEEIRSLEEFNRDVLPPSEKELLQSAAWGPIIIVNVSGHRCDALIVRHDGIENLPLPQVSIRQIHAFRNHLVRPSPLLLSWLWDSIVGPVLETLGFTHPLPDTRQRVWWVPTGLLVGFPLHAAGHHLSKEGNTALDCIVSSYASSLKAIAHLRRQRRPETSSIRRNFVLVAMEDTPERAHLQFAKEEIEQVRKFAKPMKLSPKLPLCTKSAVSSALNDCKIFHFAGHGITDTRDPLHSNLLLEDWKTSPLTVESLLETNMQQTPPFLAYLSACGSGQILNSSSFDEGTPLCSAFQLAGFRHVIGTLWNVEDNTCVSMAESTYNTLQKLGLSDEAVSYALHSAIKAHRDQWVEGVLFEQEKEVESHVESQMPVDAKGLFWVPYVHFGI